MKSLTYLVYAKYIHFCNLFLIICSFLVLSFLFNLTTLKPITYSETIMLCVLGRFSHSHKFIMKLDNSLTHWAVLPKEMYDVWHDSVGKYPEPSGLKKYILSSSVTSTLVTSTLQGFCRAGNSRQLWISLYYI